MVYPRMKDKPDDAKTSRCGGDWGHYETVTELT